MLHLFLAEAEPSKVPFYIAGGLFAVWAVALASIGLTRPAFPYNIRGQWTVIGISFILLVASIATAIATSK
jgi:hypothetical protein